MKSINPIKDLYSSKGTNKICCPDLCQTCGEKDEIVQNLWWRRRSHNLGGISNVTGHSKYSASSIFMYPTHGILEAILSFSCYTDGLESLHHQGKKKCISSVFGSM
jgi:hypothetical protein